MKDFVAQLSIRQKEFIIPELIQTAKVHNINMNLVDEYEPNSGGPKSSFIILKFLDDKDAKKFAENSLSVKIISSLIIFKKNIDEIKNDLKDFDFNNAGKKVCINVQTFKKKIKYEDKLNYINILISLFKTDVSVDIKNPDIEYTIFLDFNDTKDEYPKGIYIGEKIAHGNFNFFEKFTLKKRMFINTTSMDADLSFYCAIQGLSKPGKVIWDPFCGSGSILIAAAALGANVIGSDIDLLSMTEAHFKNTKTTVLDNFEQYNISDKIIGFMKYDILKDYIDFSRFNIDSIITDPPYGIREKIETQNKGSILLPLLLRLYKIADIVLRVGGRLVYWLPCAYNLNTDTDLPKHPNFVLIHDSRQDLTLRYCRHLLTFEKINDEKHYEAEFANMEASWLKVRDLVFERKEDRITRLGLDKKGAKKVKNV